MEGRKYITSIGFHILEKLLSSGRKSAVLPRYMLDFIDLLKDEEQKSPVPDSLP